ncbi:efflux RND transporter periplasmic adaptor subunit [Microbulbifer hydrolyticus]|uniref:Efflux RND transporter periplasmic adaptor subunit n=1 Tax=Microbulbifer hydrolyticus TaxID=48074 RepID=A0A6P1TAI6_9GAMM|nr:efflux RND transporter periplasmic adaptor subunit [Microbulbifer hydrolyticus]MBB5210903.1 membrane fusion protein (multidrug efflux system) [Microbulbifer hydrolyticus]QHQ38279.1 efflux RND transporter periplasmic adaptor subunit [Microbulbifer hydrolyticus]
MTLAKQLFNRRMLWMLLGCLLVFGGIFGFKLFGKYMMNQFMDNMPLPSATVTTARVAQQRWQTTLSAVGSVRAINGVNVTTQAQGEVKAIYFESGQQVEKGTLLAELSANPETAQIEVLEAERRLAERDYQRISVLYKKGVATLRELDQAKAAQDQVLANLSVQRATIRERSITAPFSGQLGIRQIDLGQNVAPGDAVVSLQQLQPIYVDFSLAEQDFSRVKLGQKISLAAAAVPEETFRGRISAIDPAIDPRNRTFLLQATLENAERKLRPGMFTEVSVEVEKFRTVLVVPRTAISYAPYGNAVFVIRKPDTQEADSSAKGDAQNPEWIAVKRFVKTGEERGDMIEITQGLEAGEQVATSGLLKLRNEGGVIINNDNPPPEQLSPQPDNR